MMFYFCVEQRMLPPFQLTALAGRVVEEEGGWNSMLVQGWNNTKLSISCVLQLVLYYSVYDVTPFMMLSQILWIYRF